MNSVIDKLVEVISTMPGPVLSPSQLGVKKPAIASDIPAISVSLIIGNNKGNGIGRFIRTGDSTVQNTSVVEVLTNPDTFLSGFETMRIWPLPLKKNPSSAKKEFTDDDIHIRNVTDTSNIIDYQMTEKPTLKSEYKLDVPRAQIVFGEAQTEADKLEMAHWTVTWGNEILGDAFNGTMVLEIWANSFEENKEISQRLQDKLQLNRPLLRQKGFLKLQPASLESAENLSIDPPVGSAFSAWRQKLGYTFAFEIEEGGELSSGIPIKRIDVDMNKHLVETFSIP